MRFKISAILICLTLCAVQADESKGNPTLEKKQLVILASHGAKVPISVEVARTDKEHTYGLMYRDAMGENDGMLFIFDADGYRNFWMKNTRMALSIAYISSNGTINEIYEMKPLDVSITYPSAFPCRYALEMNKGWFAKKGIKPGSKVVINFK
jgi:uncharacterized protein